MSDSFETLWIVACQAPLCFLGKNIGVVCHFLLQGIFPTQELDLYLLHYRQTFFFFATEQPGKPFLFLLCFSDFSFISFYEIKTLSRTSLVVQWIRIHLPMQRAQVQFLVWGDSTCHGATKPVHHNYWGPCDLEWESHNFWACTLQLLKPLNLCYPNEKMVHHSEEQAPHSTTKKA